MPQNNRSGKLKKNNFYEIDTKIVEEAVIYSETLINGYLRNRYTIPLSDIPPIIKYLLINLVDYRLCSKQFQTKVPEVVLLKYKNAVKTLEQIQNGIVSLGFKHIQKGFKNQKGGNYAQI